ncbi:MAG: hypothetical protein AAGD35_19120 [Actinomycetota bacterium]
MSVRGQALTVARRVGIVIAAIGLSAGALTGCGGGDEELTTAQMLAKLEGRTLTEEELTERLALADLLCGFENRVLLGVWERLDARQLEFQDWVFGQHCPQRLGAYADARPDMGTAPFPPAAPDLPGGSSTTSTTRGPSTTSLARITERTTPTSSTTTPTLVGADRPATSTTRRTTTTRP